MLILSAIVSFRSVPKIFNLIHQQTPLKIDWIPHFSSIINWHKRVGLGMLKSVKPIKQKWIAIIDHSIDIGIKKVLVVLRVKVETISKINQAITLKECECIGVTVSTKISGENIKNDLKKIFAQSGDPIAIIKDNDPKLHKGVVDYIEDKNIAIIEDVTHVIANALKKEYQKSKSYKEYMQCLRNGAQRLRQTDLSFLIPPKLRKKGRFQAIRNLTKWGEKILETQIFAQRGRAKKGTLLERLRKAFPKLYSLKSFIYNFAKTTTVTSEIMQVLKNRGLDNQSYHSCMKSLKKLPKNSQTRKSMRLWLEKHIKIQQKITNYPLLITSDIIESLFGNFKQIVYRSPQNDMNALALLIPTLCGNLDKENLLDILHKTQHKEIKAWERENVPYTMRQQRQQFFNKSSKKAEINKEE